MLYHVLWLIFGEQGDNDNDEICIYLINKSPINKSAVRTWSGVLGPRLILIMSFPTSNSGLFPHITLPDAESL